MKSKSFYLFICSIVISLLLSFSMVYAAPGVLTFQAKIYKPDGTLLNSSSVNFKFKYTDNLGTCVFYEEDFNSVDMSASSGTVTLSLGSVSATKVFPTNATTLADVFSYGSALACKSSVPSATVTPLQTDRRYLIVEFNDGAITKTLPAMSINSVPFALQSNYAASAGNAILADSALSADNALTANVANSANTASTAGDADMLGGFLANLYPKFSDFTSAGCIAGQALRYNGSVFVCEAVGTGTVTGVSSANSYLSIVNSTTTPQLTLNVGTLANTLAAGNDSRIIGALQAASNLSDLGNVSTARTNLGLGTASMLNVAIAGDAGAAEIVKGNDSRLNTYTPVNRAGDTMTGALNLPVGGLNVGVNQFVVSGDGSVGIGAHDPNFFLNVSGTASFKDNVDMGPFVRISNVTAGNQSILLSLLNSGSTNGTGSGISFEGYNAGSANLFNTGYLGAIVVDNTVNSERTDLIFYNVNTGRTNLIDQMRLHYNGYLSLGGGATPVAPIKASVALANGASLSAAGVWTNGSDGRLKKDIIETKYGLKEVLKMRPVNYVMKNNDEHQVGFIAQEMKKIIPEVVSGTEGDLDKGETLGISYGNLSAVIVKAIQQIYEKFTSELGSQSEKIKKLQDENLKLQKQIESQNTSIKELQKQFEKISKKVK